MKDLESRSKNNFAVATISILVQKTFFFHAISLFTLSVQDTSALDLPSSDRGHPHTKPPLFCWQGIPAGCVLSHQNTLPDAEDGAKRKMSLEIVSTGAVITATYSFFLLL